MLPPAPLVKTRRRICCRCFARRNPLAIKCADACAIDDAHAMLIFKTACIYLHREPVDFRKSINGLTGVVQESMALNVFSKSLFLFATVTAPKSKYSSGTKPVFVCSING